MTELSPPAAAQTTSKNRQILRDLVKGVLFIALLAGVKVIVEHTSLGETIEESGYDWLQRRLASSDPVPVVVVDITDLEPQEFNVNGQIGVATPRKTLQGLIAAATEQKARAIGVDIDFSPDTSGYIWPGDPQFFDFCLQNKVPVFLGISRTESLTPDKWLGSDDFQPLAASMIVPSGDTRKMPKWIRVDKDAARGPTLGAALAGGFQRSESSLANWLHRYQLVDQVSERELGQGVEVGEFPVDYSPLKSLIDKTLKTTNPIVIKDQGHLLRDKIVLFGRGKLSNDADRFTVESFEQQVPGVYIHACAAYTLRNAPLYELTWPSRLGVDLSLSLVVLLSVVAVRAYFRNRKTKLAENRLQFAFSFLIVLLALIFGVGFVAKTRILWSDFLLVVAMLILHVPLERPFAKASGVVRNVYKGAKPRELLNALFVEKGKNGTK